MREIRRREGGRKHIIERRAIKEKEAQIKKAKEAQKNIRVIK